MVIFHLFLFFLASLYGLFICFLIVSILRPLREKTIDQNKEHLLPGVSIVIPFRNEASNLGKLITSLNNQRYNGSVEIILVNDGSTDDYNNAISALPSNHPIKIIDSTFSPEKHLTSKQQALELGIHSAAHDWIALTDADIQLEPHWLSSLMDHATQDTSLVFGHTVIRTGERSGLFDWFQAFQLETLFGVAYAFFRSGLAGSCMGNNVLVSKKAFNAIGGYTAMGYSITEDCDLLRTLRKKGYRIAATEPFSPTGVSAPSVKFRDYVNQLMRWAKGGFSGNLLLGGAGLLLGIQNILFIGGVTGVLTGPVALIVFLNLLLTWLFIIIVFKKIQSRERALHFWPFYLLFLIESFVIVVALVLRRPVIWKERRI
jgi:cellulose synthase/poly-beta-1,6-N-acetylglucosamine synthase-like glycosyltransferase